MVANFGISMEVYFEEAIITLEGIKLTTENKQEDEK